MSLTEAFVRERLSHFIDPHTETDLQTAGAVKGVGIAGSKVSVELRLSYRNKPCRKVVGTCHVPFTKNQA